MSWNKTYSKKPQGAAAPKNARPLRGLLFILAALAAIGVLSVILLHSGDSEPAPAPSVPASTGSIPLALPVPPRVAAKSENIFPNPPMDEKKQIAPGYRQPSNPDLPRKKWFPTVEEVEKARLGPDGKPRKMSIYKTPIEQTLGIIFTTRLGNPPPMIPNVDAISSAERIQKFIDTEMAYDNDAAESVKENRMMMQQVKDEFKRYLEEGGKPEGFVEYYQNELRIAYDEWKTAQKMLIDMSRNGENPQVMREFRDRANELLSERGIKPLAVPPFVRQSMGEE